MQVGATVGPWQVLGELGRGGCGVVLRARRDGGSPVALKVLLEPLDGEGRLRFEREGRVLLGLAHPHLVRVLDHGATPAGHPWLALELLEGGTLEERLRRAGPLEPRQVIDLGLALAQALEVVHAAGLIHRDLKPANVLHGSDGRPRLTDFGLTRGYLADATRVTASGVILGTPAYMAPEQVRGDEVGPPADVYALGATLYCALTGRPPFVGGTAMAVMSDVMFQAPEPPSRLRPGVPAGLEALLLRCLEKDPRRRPPHAQALREELERLVAAPVRSAAARRILGLVAASALSLTIGAGLVLALGPAPAPAPTSAGPATAADTSSVVPAREAPAEPAPVPSSARAEEEPRERRQGFAEAKRAILAATEGGDHEAALQLADELVRTIRPRRRAEAHFLRGRVREAAGDIDGALADVEQALAIEPGAAWADEAHWTRTRLTSRRGSARDLTREGERLLDTRRDAEAAERSFREALALHPRLAQAHQGLGVALHRLGRSVAAIDALDRAATLAPTTGEVRFSRAQVWLDRGEAARAREDLEAAGRLAGGAQAPWLVLARMQLARLDAAALPGGTAAELVRRGELRSRLSVHAAALEDLDRACALDPDSVPALLERGQARLRSGDHAAAVTDLERACQLDPGSARGFALLGAAFLATGAPDAAWTASGRALGLDPAQVDGLLTRAALRELRQDPVGALADLDRALELRPDIHGLWARAAHHARAGRDEAWRKDAARLVALEPASAAEWLERGMTRGGLGDLAGGLADLDAAVTLAPGSSRAWYCRGVLFERASDPVRAARLRGGADPGPRRPAGRERAGCAGPPRGSLVHLGRSPLGFGAHSSGAAILRARARARDRDRRRPTGRRGAAWSRRSPARDQGAGRSKASSPSARCAGGRLARSAPTRPHA